VVAGSTQLPDFPLLAPWYRVVEEGERLVFEHGGRVVSFEGAAVRRLLPRLLPLLDGTRTVAEVIELVGAPVEQAVQKALALLEDRGLLAAGPPPDCGGELAATVGYLAATGGLAPAVVAGRIADACVGLVGEGAAAVEVARVLRRAGVPRIERRGWDDAGAGDDLVVVAPGSEERARVREWNEAALAAGVTWLQVLPYDGRFAAIGPLVLPGESACHVCFLLRRAAGLGIGELADALDAAPLRAEGGPALSVAAGAIAAVHVLRWLGVGDPSLPGVLYALEATGGLALTAHDVLRVPRCPACSTRAWSAAPLPWFQTTPRRERV
jgi:bacteriocin biosynthesis cyclodehydratase domain-containing protein